MGSTIIVLTGPIRTGKTSRLAAWAAGRTDVGGVLQPVGASGRFFADAATGETCPLEPVLHGEAETLVGRFRFRAAAFAWANARLAEAAARTELAHIIIDEIGPLELRGDGLRVGVAAALQANATLLLVVREGLVAAALDSFQLAHATVLPAEVWPQVGQAANGVP